MNTAITTTADGLAPPARRAGERIPLAKFDHWRVVENRTSTGDGCRFTYDLAAGLTTVEHYDGQTRRHYWNAQNLIVRYVDERGENWRYEWDDNELLTRRIDPLGNAVTFVYDEMGNRVQEIDADGNTRTTTWLEHRALPSAIIEADGSATRFWYDEHHAEACGRPDGADNIAAPGRVWSGR